MCSSTPLKVFISSTSVDLRVEYQAAIETVLRCGHWPAGVGQFALDFPLSELQTWITASDVYVLILGDQYGTLLPNSTQSAIHLEYDYAIAQNKPVLAFLIAESALQDQSTNDSDLDAFRQQLQIHTPYCWTNADDIRQGLQMYFAELASTSAQDHPDPPLNPTESLTTALQTLQTFAQSILDIVAVAREAQRITDQALSLTLEGETIAQGTVTDLAQVRAMVADSTRTAKRLAENAQQLSKIVTLVTQVASRTNVIALNASLEVSRMGTRGAEFASVANDMRQLASHTGKAAEAVDKIIRPMQEKTSQLMTTLAEGVQSAIASTQTTEHTQATLTQLSQLTEQLDQLVRMVAKATDNQAEASRCIVESVTLSTSLPAPAQIAQSLQTLTASISGTSDASLQSDN